MTRRPAPPMRVVLGASLALFLFIFALLVFQLRSGRDPALGGVGRGGGPGAPAAPEAGAGAQADHHQSDRPSPAEDGAQPATVVSAPGARRRGAGDALRPRRGAGAGARAGPPRPGAGSPDDAQLMSEQDVSFPSMGSDARVVVDGAEAEPLRAFLARLRAAADAL